LKWTKNERQLGRRNGQEFVVKAIEGRQATIEYRDGKQEEVDLNLPQHLDYSYVSTTYSSQGKTAERVFVASDFTVGKESFYVAVSRVKSDLRVYTCDKQELLDLASISRAKENPLELLRKKAWSQESEVAPLEVEDIEPSALKVSPDNSEILRARLEYLACVNDAAELMKIESLSQQDLDVGVAMLMIKHGKTNQDISRVLSQSDITNLSANYINSIIETAANLRRKLLQQKRELER
jgi:hypothetical protein